MTQNSTFEQGTLLSVTFCAKLIDTPLLSRSVCSLSGAEIVSYGQAMHTIYPLSHTKGQAYVEEFNYCDQISLLVPPLLARSHGATLIHIAPCGAKSIPRRQAQKMCSGQQKKEDSAS